MTSFPTIIGLNILIAIFLLVLFSVAASFLFHRFRKVYRQIRRRQRQRQQRQSQEEEDGSEEEDNNNNNNILPLTELDLDDNDLSSSSSMGSSSSNVEDEERNNNNNLMMDDALQEILDEIRLAQLERTTTSAVVLSPEERKEYVSNVLIVKQILYDNPNVSNTSTTTTTPSSSSSSSSLRKNDYYLDKDFIFLSDIQKVKCNNQHHDSHQNNNNNNNGTDEQQLWTPANMEDITTIPTPTSTTTTASCAICLNDYTIGDEVCWSHNRRCNHHFHLGCLSSWLVQQHRDDCPFCRNNYLALSEDEGDDNDDNDDDDSSETDIVGAVLAQTITTTTRPTPTPPPRPESPPPPLRTRSIRLEGEDPWTGVPMHFFDHRFSNVLRPRSNVNVGTATATADGNNNNNNNNTMGPTLLNIAIQQRDNPPTTTASGGNAAVGQEDVGGRAAASDSNYNVPSESGSSSSIYGEDGTLEDESDMWSCGAADIEDGNGSDDDEIRNRFLMPRWQRKKRQRPPQYTPTTTAIRQRQHIEQGPSSWNNNINSNVEEETVNLELSELIVEGLMIRLEENQGNDEQSTRTVSSGSVYLQREDDDDNDDDEEAENDKLRQQKQQQQQVPDGVCAICLCEYGVNEALCWSQDPGCDHCFHRSCLKDWIEEGNDVCPLCALRNELVKGTEENDDLDRTPTSNNCQNKTNFALVENSPAQLFEDSASSRVETSLSGHDIGADDSMHNEQQRNSNHAASICRADAAGSGYGEQSKELSNASQSRSPDLSPRLSRLAQQPNRDGPLNVLDDSSWNSVLDYGSLGGGLDEENSQGMSIGSWTATSDVVSTTLSFKNDTGASRTTTEDDDAILPHPGSKSQTSLEVVCSNNNRDVGEIESSLEEWDAIIDTFARMNKLRLSSKTNHSSSNRSTIVEDR